MHGKIKTVFGIYKKHGRTAFLNVAQDYSCHVKDTVEATVSEMESRWYDAAHTVTEAEKMVEDYNNGLCSLSQTESMSEIDMVQAM
jgi:hypothetical protein